MPQRGAGGTAPGGSRDDDGRPPRLVAFDPVGEIVAVDNRDAARGSAAAARAARADAFAARFGVDETGPSAATLADRFGFRYEQSVVDPALATGRRTVTITGRGSARAIAPAQRTLGPARARRSDRTPGRAMGRGASPVPVVRADRLALIAVGLGIVLALLAATSAHL